MGPDAVAGDNVPQRFTTLYVACNIRNVSQRSETFQRVEGRVVCVLPRLHQRAVFKRLKGLQAPYFLDAV